MKIWRCPACEAGVRAPGKLGRLDVRRWCLPCSKRTGKLVERTVPSREAEAARRSAARAAATAKRQERRAVADVAASDRVRELATAFDRRPDDAAEWLRAWAPRIVALTSLRAHFREHYPGRRWAPQITIRQGHGLRERVPRADVDAWLRAHLGGWSHDADPSSPTVQVAVGRISASGRARPWAHSLVMTTGLSAADDLSTLVHELSHLAAPQREVHGPLFVLVQREAVEELTGERIEGWRRHGAHCRVDVISRWLERQAAAVQTVQGGQP